MRAGQGWVGQGLEMLLGGIQVSWGWGLRCPPLALSLPLPLPAPEPPQRALGLHMSEGPP